VVGQVALSFALLVGAGLMIKSLRIIYATPEGFKTADLVVLNLILPQERYSTGARQAALFAGTEERISATPGMAGVTFASGAPPDVRLGERGDLEIEGRVKAQADKDMDVPSTDIEPNYFRVLGIPLLQGRTFTVLDGATDSSAVIINQTMARRYWPKSSPIGKRFRLGDSPQDWHTVVGIVGDVKEFDWKNRPSQLELFEPMPTGKTTDTTWVSLIVRTVGNTAGGIKSIKEAVWSQDKEIVVDRIATYEQLESRALSLPQFYAQLMAVFAAIALLLSMIGIYGVISYSTTLRTREIGIRMALGAEANHAVMMVIREGLAPAGLGVLLGIVCSAMMTRIIARFLYGITPADPATFVTVSMIYLCVALVASLLPARRASRVDPMVALRNE
jgi:putative ABC transport system permease protein